MSGPWQLPGCEGVALGAHAMGERLLIIDDEADFRAYVRQVAEAAGYEVAEAGDPITFMEYYETHRPSVVIVDIILPNIDGIELVRWLAERGFSGQLAVVTGHSPRYARAAEAVGRANGMTVFVLTKPVATADLRAAIARA
jgi:CheY-like chemotaxis protein